MARKPPKQWTELEAGQVVYISMPWVLLREARVIKKEAVVQGTHAAFHYYLVETASFHSGEVIQVKRKRHQLLTAEERAIKHPFLPH